MVARTNGLRQEKRNVLRREEEREGVAYLTKDCDRRTRREKSTDRKIKNFSGGGAGEWRVYGEKATKIPFFLSFYGNLGLIYLFYIK